MIGNISRVELFKQCRRKYFNWHNLGLQALREPDVIIVGEAFHKGTAHLTSTRNRDEALALAEKTFRERMGKQTLLPEEIQLIEQQIELVKRMIGAEADQYEKDDWEILMPEVNFCVPFPGTEHHCWFFHQLLCPETAFKQCPGGNSVLALKPSCWQPHYIMGITDAVLAWNKLIWLMERKTSGMKQGIFWDQWHLAVQPTGYIYGIWKSTGIRPHGFILEKVPKPAKNQDPFSFNYSPEREPYLRSDEDLAEFELEFIAALNDIEQAEIRVGLGEDPRKVMYKHTASCTDFNRKCFYWDLCKRNHKLIEGEFRQREPDYVQNKYYEILGIRKEVAPAPTP